jgi:hypothetical protein
VRTAGPHRSLYALWRRWWFHLGALMVLVPLCYLKSYMDLQAMWLEAQEEDLRSVDVMVGPWTLQLQEREAEEPYWDPREGYEKSFRIVPCPACGTQIRAVFISLKRPGSSKYGEQAEGNPARLFAEMKLGRGMSSDDLVWLTAEGWDGSRHQAKLPLAQASPVTSAWIGRNASTEAAQ